MVVGKRYVLSRSLEKLQIQPSDKLRESQEDFRSGEAIFVRSASRSKKGNVLDANALTRSFRERDEIFLEVVTFLWVRPALRDEVARIREDVFVVVD
jgi:hypothetical protein